MLDNDLFRATIISIIVIVVLLFGNLKPKSNKLVLLILVLHLLGEMITLFVSGYNLIHYSLLSVTQITLLGWIVVIETKKTLPVVSTIGFVYLLYTFFLFSNYSSSQLFDWSFSIEGEYPIDVNQYYDISTLINLCSLILVFVWLHAIVNSDSTNISQIRSTFIFIFSFLLLYGGTFFILAFGRVLLDDYESWSVLWNSIFLPIDAIVNVAICIGLLWE